MNSQEIFGAEIQYFRLDPQYWDLVLRQFKETGLRCVTTYVQWSTHLVGEHDARHPAGVLDFEGRTDSRLNLLRFLDLIHKHDLNLNFRAGPFCCNEAIHGGYPHWLVTGDPSIMVWDYQNRTTQGYWTARREGSQPSYLHPTYLDWCRKWIDQVDQIIKPRLKSNGGFITMINLDNEISYIIQDSFLDSDYNPVNVQPGGLWHQFLTEKYRTASQLPYGRRYESIENVPPPRNVPQHISDDIAWYLDWMNFKTWSMSRYIHELRSMHESNGVKDVTFMTNFNPHLPEGVPTRMPEFEKAVGDGGIVGYDFYRGAFMSYSGYHSMARVLKLMNASVGYTWAAEFMSGSWNKDMTKSGRISDDHMRFMARCALSQGCKSIGWFMFHDRDCWGDAPVSSHGHRRPSWEVLRETPEILFNKIANWDALVPCCDVGIVYDLLQHQHTSIGDPQPCDDSSLHIGKPSIDGVEAGWASQEYIGLFRLVEHAGVQPGVIDILHDAKLLTKYPLVLLPGSPLIHMQTNVKLTEYVTCGGTLILSGPWPTRDERGNMIRFLGCTQPEPSQAIVEISLGKGKFLWHRNYLAGEHAKIENQTSIAFIRKWIETLICAHVRITPTKTVNWIDWAGDHDTGGGLKIYEQARNLGSAILHRNEKETMLFVLNHYIEPATFRLDFKDTSITNLVDLDSGLQFAVTQGQVLLDIDRKYAAMFRIQN